MNTAKPELLIDLDNPIGRACLRTQLTLSCLKPNTSYHEKYDCRHPLGIYNVSTSRILRKLCDCAGKLEALQCNVSKLEELDKWQHAREGIVDYLELCLYAAAEHVDDIYAITLCLFQRNALYERSKAVRKLKDDLKPIRDRISAVTNAIKHRHSRIRFLSMDLEESGISVCLHGFFVENFHNGGVTPAVLSRVDGKQIISVTSFLWSIICYLFLVSELFAEFAVSIGVVDATQDAKVDNSLMHKSVIALARLPLYAFDETHPFEKVRVIINGGEKARTTLESRLHGSILHRWNRNSVPKFGKSRMDYEGDGTTRQFDIAHPKMLKLSHWD